MNSVFILTYYLDGQDVFVASSTLLEDLVIHMVNNCSYNYRIKVVENEYRTGVDYKTWYEENYGG